MEALTPDLLAPTEQWADRKFPSARCAALHSRAPRMIAWLQMIRHIVMWKLRGPSAEERRSQAEQVKAALLSMLGKIPGMTQVEVGIGTASGEQEADVVLASTHDSWQALADYQKHPAHEPVKQLIGELRVERRAVD